MCVKELLEESQARTDIKDRNGETPMHFAAKQDSPAIIQVSISMVVTGTFPLTIFFYHSLEYLLVKT